MDRSVWKKMSAGEQINWLIEQLRWGRSEFFDLVEIKPGKDGLIIHLPRELWAEQAVVIVLKPTTRPQDARESDN